MTLLAWYPLNGDTLDYSGNGNNATNNGAVINANGKIGQCYTFTESGSNKIRTNLLYSYGSLTIAFWLNNTSTAQRKLMGNRPDGDMTRWWELEVSSTGQVRFELADNYSTNYYTSPNTSASTGWNHFVAVISQGSTTSIKIYKNGILEVNQQSVNSRLWNLGTTDYIDIGNDLGGTGCFGGSINDVRLYNHVLSDKEIYELSRAKILHYKFDDFQEPTTNLAVGKSFTNNYSADITTGSDSTGNYFIKNQSTYVWTGMSLQQTSVQAGQSYTFSLEIMCDVSFNLAWDANDYSTNYTGNDATRSATVANSTVYNNPFEWQQIYITNTIKSDAISPTAGDTFCPTDSTVFGHKIYYRNIQLEQKDHPTLYVNGSRTATINDCSGFNNNTTLTESDTPKWTNSSKIGKGCFDFNGDTQYISTSSFKYKSLPSFTLSAWIYPRTSKAFATIMGETFGNNLDAGMMLANQNLVFHDYSTTNTDVNYVTSVDLVPLNAWTHVSATYDSGNIALYINGVQTGTGTGTLSGTTTNPFMINSKFNNSGVTRGMNGYIDDVRVYATALSSNDIFNLYTARTAIDNTGNLFTQQITEYIPLGTTDYPAASAKDILNSNNSQGNGVYWILPKGETTMLPVYCDLTNDGGGWNRVFYHNNHSATVLFASNAEAIETNTTAPTSSDKYSILSKLESFRNDTSKQFEFMLKYPELGHRNIWRQTSNFTSQPVAGYQAITIDDTANGWGGLEYNGGPTLADGTVNSSNWYYAVGSKTAWSGAIPGPNSAINIVELYVREVENLDFKSTLSNKGQFTVNELNEIGITNGFVAWYNLQNDARDYSGNGYDLVNTDGIQINNGATFTGDVTKKLYSTTFPQTNNVTFTWSAWISCSGANATTNPYQFVVSQGRDVTQYGVNINVGNTSSMVIGNIYVLVGGTTTITTGASALNNMRHVVVTADGTNVYVYIDGQLTNTVAQPIIDYSQSSSAFVIGKMAYGYTGTTSYFPFNGNIKDVRIYNRTLSNKEVNILYAIGNSSRSLQMSNDGILYVKNKLKEN